MIFYSLNFEFISSINFIITELIVIKLIKLFLRVNIIITKVIVLKFLIFFIYFYQL
jgi:hypothetical protein